MTGRLAGKLVLGRKPRLPVVGIAAVAGAVVFGLMNAPQIRAQSPAVPEWQTAAGGKMAFDVASIRPTANAFASSNVPLDAGESYSRNGGFFSARFPLGPYIEFAYKLALTPDQYESMLAHQPRWVASDYFAIQARAPSENPTKDQMRLMMQSLLAERFKLAVHFESRIARAFALTLIQPGKTGPGLRRPQGDIHPCDTQNPQFCGKFYVTDIPGHMLRLQSPNASMAQIANSLGSIALLGRPVVDQTGLTGNFDFTLEWAQESNGPPQSGADDQLDVPGPSFSQALKEQLGIKLVKQSAQVQALVIDHIERPSPN